MRFPLLLAILILACCPANAQFNLAGSAMGTGGGCVQLTPPQNGQLAAAWYQETIDISQDFQLDFTVNLGTNDVNGADGIAWVLHTIGDCATSPTTGGGIGYNDTPPYFDPALILEIDTWQNGWAGDPFYDHVALQRDGSCDHTTPACLAGCPPNTIQASATDANIEDGQDHDVTIAWNAATQTFTMDFDGVERINTSLDIVNTIFGGNTIGWWGFTSSTGGANNLHSFCLVDAVFTSGNPGGPTGIPGLTFNPSLPAALCPAETQLVGASSSSVAVSWLSTGTGSAILSPGEHTLQATTGTCTYLETITVDALPGPNLSTQNNVTICDGTPTILTASAASGSTLDWDGTGNNQLTVNTGGNHTVNATLGSCAESITVTVTDQASPNLTLSASGTIDICDGDAANITASTDIPANVQWTNNNNGAVTNGNTLSTTTAGQYLVEAEAGGCPGAPDVVVVDVLPLPTANLQSIPNALCWGETGLVTAVPNSGSTVTSWILPTGTSAVTQAGAGAYTANLLGANGCTSTATYILTELPPIVYQLDGPAGACDGETVELTVSGIFDGATWSNGSTGNALLLTNADGSGPFSVTVSVGNCSATSSTPVEWWPVPSVGNLADSVDRCVLDPAVEWTWPSQSQSAVGWWVWSVNGLTTTGGPVWEAEGDYTVRVMDSMTGCADSTAVYVNVLPNLDVEAAPFAGIVCWDEATEVLAELRAVDGTDLDELPYTLEWDDPDVEGLNPTVGAGTYRLIAENDCGSDVAVVEVTQEYCGCDMWMPTAFTPDNDGFNDGLKMETNCPELDAFELVIYNRWGEAIWRTDDPDRVWMGQSETANSEGQYFSPDGIYGYRVYWKYGELGVPIVEERTGFVHLIR